MSFSEADSVYSDINLVKSYIAILISAFLILYSQ